MSIFTAELPGPADPRNAAFHVSIAANGNGTYRRIGGDGTTTDVSRGEFMTEVATRLQRQSRVPIVLVGGCIAAIAGAFGSAWLSIALAVATVALALYTRSVDAARRAILLRYDVAPEIARAYGSLLSAIAWMRQCAVRASSRGVVNVATAGTPFTTDIGAPQLTLGDLSLQFFPDGLFVLHARNVWFVPYDRLTVQTNRVRQVVRSAAHDSVRVGQQWEHQRKDGTPDRRYAVNPLLAIVETGQMSVIAEGVLHEIVSLSNPAAADHFRDAAQMMANPTPQPNPQPNPQPIETRQAPSPPPVKPRQPERDNLIRAVIKAAQVRVEVTTAAPKAMPIPDGGMLWTPPMRRVTVHGFDIGGFVYVGEALRGLDVHLPEPALIDPTMDVSDPIAPVADSLVGYSPAYSRLPRAVRGAFLSWLADGRRDPDVPIGFVFLFFYGLERRVFEYLAGKGSDTAECIAIAREIERLLAIYHQTSFTSYASGLLDLLSAREPELIAPSSNDHRRPGEPLPFMTRVAMGKLAAAGAILPPDLALRWLRSSGRALRTPAERCPNEFTTLFAMRYAEILESGVRLRPNKTPLTVRYAPASPALRERSIKIETLPDVTALTKPLADIERVAVICCNELDPYSRWIAKNPYSAGTLAAISILPPDLAARVESEDIRALTSFLADRLGDADNVSIGADELLAYWSVKNPLKIAKSEAVQLAQALDRIGFALEPDVRFGGAPPVSAFVSIAAISEGVSRRLIAISRCSCRTGNLPCPVPR